MFLESRRPALLSALVSCFLSCASQVPRAAEAPSVPTPRGAAAQTSSPVRAIDRDGTASISGKVLSSTGGTPLARARIVLASAALSEARVALSAADGSFQFAHLPGGTYSLSASRTGYASAVSGGRQLPTLTLARGQALEALEIPLSPAGVIVGRILDEDNTHLAGATIEAMAPRTDEGLTTLRAVATTQSDDRGDFRLTGLPAGQYYISAFDPAFVQVGDETGPLGYAPTYFPGVPSVEGATRVTVTPGVEPDGRITFALRLVRPSRVSGQIAAAGRQLLSAAVVMTRADPVLPTALGDAEILPTGAFTFRNVPPGIYQIRARGEIEPGGTTHFATFRVMVEGQDVTDLRLDMLPGATVTGTLVFDGVRTPRPASLAGIRVRAPLADGRTFGDAVTGEVQPNGTYAIRGLIDGSHILTVEGLPYPWVLKSVTLRGQDITDVGVDASARGRLDNVAIVVTDAASELSGVVRDATRRAVPQAIVLVIPLAQQFWHRTSRRFGLLRTDGDGRFTIRGLPEGEYRVVASQDLDESDAFRRAVLERLTEAALPLTLDGKSPRELDLPLTSVPAGVSSR